MSAQTGKSTHKKNEGNHDNCDDCKKEKKENEYLIGIYQKLQEVQKKAIRVRRDLDHHRTAIIANQSVCESLQSIIDSIPKAKSIEEGREIQKLGFEIAAVLIEKEKKSNWLRQNQRLRDVIARMQNVKDSQPTKEPLKVSRTNFLMERASSSMTTTLNQAGNTGSSSFPSKGIFYIEEIEHADKTIVCSEIRVEGAPDDITTQSSSFSRTGRKKNIDLIKYNSLNLWLYENEKNIKLEEELYLVKYVTRSTLHKRGTSLLPTIRARK